MKNTEMERRLGFKVRNDHRTPKLSIEVLAAGNYCAKKLYRGDYITESL